MRPIIFLITASIILSLLPLTSSSQGRGTSDPTGIANLVDKVKRGVLGVSSGLDATDDPALAGGNITSGGGSGFIIDKQGHFISNFHVMGRASVVQVRLWDGTTYKARRVASDVSIDIALGKIEGIEPSKLFPVKLGDSDEIHPGDMTLAMGNPGSDESYLTDISRPGVGFLMSSTATARVVSGMEEATDFSFTWWTRGRRRYGLQYGTNLYRVFKMQTPINGGNSGGPLFNNRGEVIGINTWGGEDYLSQNTNNSVPINLAKSFVTAVLEGKSVERPWIGIDILFPPNITSNLAYDKFKERIKERNYVEVVGIRKGGPAERAGLREGDIILSADGNDITNPNRLRTYILFGTRVGHTIKLMVRRGSGVFPIKVTTVEKNRQYAELSV